MVTKYPRWQTVVSGQALKSVDDPIIENESSGEEGEFERIAHYCRQRPATHALSPVHSRYRPLN